MRHWLLVIFVSVIGTVYAGPGPVFIANRNQWPDHVRFQAPVAQGNIVFLDSKIQFAFHSPDRPHSKAHHRGTPDGVRADNGAPADMPVYEHMFEVSFLNSHPVTPQGEGLLITRYNYFLGNDRSRWAGNVPTYNSVQYCGLYQGIDMRYYTDEAQMKYEWIVAPRANPDSIRMIYNGVTYLELDHGRLRVGTSVNAITELEPYAYQLKDGVRVKVPCLYRVRGKEVSYVFPEGYDECQELVIDPLLIFSAYSGSTQDNWGNTATYDAQGNTYSGGMVWYWPSVTGFPVTPGAYRTHFAGGEWDIGILKYDSSGSQLLYCTYLGGRDTDTPHSLVVDSAGNLLVLGTTGSDNFPVTNGTTFQRGTQVTSLDGIDYLDGADLFVAKLSENGSALLGGTYLGGSKNDGINVGALAKNYGDEQRSDIITGAGDSIYVVSNTSSSDFPSVAKGSLFHNGTHDAVVVKLTPNLSSVVWSRFVGGTNADVAYSVRLDSAENLFVSGGTNSASISGMNGRFVTNQGGIDGWVMSFSRSGDVLNGTFVGTPGYDQSYFVDLNAQGEVFVYGQTKGLYPVTAGVYSNPQSGQFIQQFDHSLKNPGLSTVVGKGGLNPDISPTAFLVSDCGYIYIGGWGGRELNTESPNYVGGDTYGLPVTPDAYQRTTSGHDFYFMVLSSDASQLIYATYIGGDSSLTHVDGGTSRFDKRGIVYQAVCAGCATTCDMFDCYPTSDFPAVNVPPLHQKNRSFNCNNLVFKFDLSQLKARVRSNSVMLDMPGLSAVCIPDKILFENFTTGGKEYIWDLGDGTHLTKDNKSPVIHQYKATGRYTVWLKAVDTGTCLGVDSASVIVNVYDANAKIQDDDGVCLGSPYNLKVTGNGGATYKWTSEDGSFSSTQQSPAISPKDTTVYYVTVTETNGCVHRDTVQINVIDTISPDFEVRRESDCFSTPSVVVKNMTDSLREGDRVFFDFGDGKTADTEEVVHEYEKDGQYTVKIVAVREFCVTEKSITMPFFTLKVPNVITPDKKDGRNDYFDIQFGQQPGTTPSDYGFKVSLVVYNRWGSEVYRANEYKYNWAGEGLAAGIYYYEVIVEDHAHCKSWIQIIR